MSHQITLHSFSITFWPGWPPSNVALDYFFFSRPHMEEWTLSELSSFTLALVELGSSSLWLQVLTRFSLE